MPSAGPPMAWTLFVTNPKRKSRADTALACGQMDRPPLCACQGGLLPQVRVVPGDEDAVELVGFGGESPPTRLHRSSEAAPQGRSRTTRFRAAPYPHGHRPRSLSQRRRGPSNGSKSRMKPTVCFQNSAPSWATSTSKRARRRPPPASAIRTERARRAHTGSNRGSSWLRPTMNTRRIRHRPEEAAGAQTWQGCGR